MKRIALGMVASFTMGGFALGSVSATGIINSPLQADGSSIGDSAFAVLIVDALGDGIEFSSPLTLTEGATYGGDNFVASVFATVDFFGSVTASGSGTFDLGGDLGAGDSYYIAWFDGTAGTASNADTEFAVTGGQAYGYANGSDWLVPSDGGTATPASVNGDTAVRGVVVPEPSIALLGCLGLLGLVRRRR